jgi:hypothetical protein
MKYIHSLIVYKNANDYLLPRDTGYVESFNNTCLIYLDKRIHYQDCMYNIKMGMAIVSWNEHVDRPFTSIYRRIHAVHPRRQCGKKAYKKKTYLFVEEIWDHLVAVAIADPNAQEDALSDHSSDSDSDVDVDNP